MSNKSKLELVYTLLVLFIVVPSVFTDLVSAKGYVHSCELKSKQNNTTALACNIYFEARGESTLGQQAVVFVTMNRLKSSRNFGDSIADVVYKPVQFSWHTDGESDRVYDSKAWDKALSISRDILNMSPSESSKADPTGGALFYHEQSKCPNWAHIDNISATIGAHIFYLRDLHAGETRLCSSEKLN